MRHVLSGMIALSLAGCSWLDDLLDEPVATVDTVFGPADELTAAQLDRLRDEAEVIEIEPTTVEEERAARADAVADAEDVIDAFVGTHPEVDGTLLQAQGPDARIEGPNLLHDLPDGRTVLLQGNDWDRLTVADVIERQQDPAHQADVVREMLPLVPLHCRALAPEDAALGALDADTLVDVRVAVIRCWMEWRGMMPAPEIPVVPIGDDALGEGPDQWSPVPERCATTPTDTDGPGQGNDGYRDVLPTEELQSWTHLTSLPPVRNQARRGSCAAFATASAIEHVLRRRMGTVADVSEQQLYSLGKLDFYGEHFDDGLPTVDFLETLVERGSAIGIEDYWGYNPSVCRSEHDGLERYRDSCVGYGNDVCSETTHQLKPVQSGGAAYFMRPRSPESVQLRVARELTLYGLTWETLAHAELHLGAGYGVVAGVRWPANDWGINATDDKGNLLAAPGHATQSRDGDEGGHAVHLIGWMRDGRYAGGGLVVFKNSWGAGWGDNGYGYLPVADFGIALKSLTVIDVRAERNAPPTIRIRENGQSFPQGSPFTLHADVSDPDDGADCCTVVWSQAGVQLGTGPTLTINPTTVGTHRIIASARDRFGALDEFAAKVDAYRNSSPHVEIERPRVGWGQDWVAAPPNEWISFSGTVTDPDQHIPCDQQGWTIVGVRSVTGCTLTTYLDPGTYVARFTAVDDAGTVATDEIRVVVRPWNEWDPPYLTITDPRAGALLRYDESVRAAFDATPSAINGEMEWTLDTQFGAASWFANQLHTFVPDDLVTVPNDWSDATLHVRLTIDGQTAWDEIPVTLLGRPN